MQLMLTFDFIEGLKYAATDSLDEAMITAVKGDRFDLIDMLATKFNA